MERDRKGKDISRKSPISTHTLTWSVTSLIDCEANHRDFNSHAHVERDFKIIRRVPSFFISTHTLTWSVTKIFIYQLPEVKDFNSHAHVERDTQRERAEAIR